MNQERFTKSGTELALKDSEGRNSGLIAETGFNAT